MRISTLTALLLPALVASHAIESGEKPASTPSSELPSATDSPTEELEMRQAAVPAVPVASLSSLATTSTLVVPAVSTPSISSTTRLTPAANPVVPGVVSSTTTLLTSTTAITSATAIASIPVANPAVPPAASSSTIVTSAPAVTAAPGTAGAGLTSLTVQWVETHIGTLRTWVPVTVTFVFADVISQAPLPGKGAIGMGSLTGETGHTKTAAQGSAATNVPGLMRGVGVAVGLGLAGLVV